MPGVTLWNGRGNLDPTVYQVSRRSFIFFRTPRPDAVDPETGERYTDVIVFWVASELEKEAILADASLPFFTTPHFDGHASVLLRGSRVGELSRSELAGFVEGAWLARAGKRGSEVVTGTRTLIRSNLRPGASNCEVGRCQDHGVRHRACDGRKHLEIGTCLVVTCAGAQGARRKARRARRKARDARREARPTETTQGLAPPCDGYGSYRVRYAASLSASRRCRLSQ